MFTIPWNAAHVAVESVFTIPWNTHTTFVSAARTAGDLALYVQSPKDSFPYPHGHCRNSANRLTPTSPGKAADFHAVLGPPDRKLQCVR